MSVSEQDWHHLNQLLAILKQDGDAESALRAVVDDYVRLLVAYAAQREEIRHHAAIVVALREIKHEADLESKRTHSVNAFQVIAGPSARSTRRRGNAMTVTVYPFREGIAYGNILWPGKHPAAGNKFPASHPCAPRTEVLGRKDDGQAGAGDALLAFRARGYWASCFPEGDGITWKPLQGQSDAQCLSDIRECFGWGAEWAKNAPVAPRDGAA